MTDQEIEDELVEENRLEDERNRLVMQQVKEVCPDEYYQDILRYLEESYNYGFKIVDEPVSEQRKTEKWDTVGEGFAFDHVFGYQVTGYWGDSYSGEMFIPLPNGKYLKFWFSM